jgi:antitoxin FitA
MSQMLIPDLDPAMLDLLRQRASQHGHSLEDEVKIILEKAAESASPSVWIGVDAIRKQLESSGRKFTDSTELLREDRDR